MTVQRLTAALGVGYERLAAWSDLLDAINVFPVADADTGRNLVVSLAPLHRADAHPGAVARRLLLSATGNSGNIACGFFSGFMGARPEVDLRAAVRAGRSRALESIADPLPGTMLTVLDELARYFEQLPDAAADGFPGLVDALARSVHATAETLPTLQAAGVVDSGALGLFLFLEGFFCAWGNRAHEFRPVTEIFGRRVRLPAGYVGERREGCCVDTVLRLGPEGDAPAAALTALGTSVVVQQDRDRVKIHLHTRRPDAVRRALEQAGRVERWSEGDLAPKRGSIDRRRSVVHIVTDAAGSITREEADELGLTLLSSYILVGDRSLPETLVPPDELYRAMRAGVKVSTAQASVFERHQNCQSLLDRHERVVQRLAGVGCFLATLLTLLHVGLDYFRMKR